MEITKRIRLFGKENNTGLGLGYGDKLTLGILSVFSLLFIAFQNNLLINIALVFAFLFIVHKFGIKTGIMAYVFLVQWERFTTMPFLSAISIIDMILGLLIIVSLCRNSFKVRIDDFILLSIVTIYGSIALIWYKDFSGLRMLFDVFIVIYIRQVSLCDEEERVSFWKTLLFYLYVSALFSILWGIISMLRGDVIRLFLAGTYITRIRSTVGTDRSCMLYCAAAIYPLLYMKNKVIKYLSLGLLSAMLLLTFSMTALVCIIAFILIFLFFKYKESKSSKRLAIILLIIIISTAFFFIWNNGSGITAIDQMLGRARTVADSIYISDYSRATTGRTDIWEWYMNIFNNEFTIFNKLFGSAVLNYKFIYSFSEYAHNTYIDMLLYMGIIPLALLFYRWIKRIREYRGTEIQLPIILLKVSYLITGLSVCG